MNEQKNQDIVQKKCAKIVHPNEFEPEHHYYPKVLNAQTHPLVEFFMRLSNERIVNRYCHFHPEVDQDRLRSVLDYEPSYFRWIGADLFAVTTGKGNRRMVVVETNSCPSGQKSFPYSEAYERGGYEKLMEYTFKPLIEQKAAVKDGKLGVIYDKNVMENSGYACAMADSFQEDVYLAEFFQYDSDPPVKIEKGILYIRDPSEKWIPMRAVFRYVTQKPWNRLPISSKTLILNPIISCLAGGRNKLMAAKAYDFFNAELQGTGMKINTPETIWDLSKNEIPLWVNRMGGLAVVKNPYSNAGQGVWTITNQNELESFMAEEHSYNKFIVQSLVGNSAWSSVSDSNRYYHIGTLPNKKNLFFAFDFRMMITKRPEGYRPLAIYARRARKPLSDELKAGQKSWDMLGTNLSINLGKDKWDTDTSRLMLMDQREFNRLGIGIDDLVEGFIQTTMAAIAIDKMAKKLITKKGELRRKMFLSLNPDRKLLDEIL